MSDSESTDSDQTVPISIRKKYRKWLKERRNEQILAGANVTARGFLIKRPALIGGGRGGPMNPYVAASPPPPPPPSPRDMHVDMHAYVPREASQSQWLQLAPPQIIMAPAPETALRLATPVPPAVVVGRGQAKPKVDLELKLWF